MESSKTKELKKILWRSTNKMGVFGCFEVTIGWYGRERLDYMTMDTKGIFRCYEIKVSKEDFRSRCKHTFVGHYNYYVMPSEVYEAVKDEIPDHVGVFIAQHGYLYSVKRAKKQGVHSSEDLKSFMIRSLCRDAAKIIDSEDETKIEDLQRQLNQQRREKERYREECRYLRQKLEKEDEK